MVVTLLTILTLIISILKTKRQTSFTLTQDDIDYREDTYKFCIPRSSRELNEAEELVNKSYRDRMKREIFNLSL